MATSPLILVAALAALAAGCATPGLRTTDASRLTQLEDREQIRQLLVDYGATLDRRDFAGFADLFTVDAEYAGGGPAARGRAAIRAQLEEILGSNPSNLPGPNFHLSFNPSVTLLADRATARSLGAYTAPDPAGGSTRLVFFVWYEDELAREDGRWKFRRRTVGSGPLQPVAMADGPREQPAGAR